MHPIIAALKHHKTAMVLVVLEIALTCGIVSNALSVIGYRIGGMHRKSVVTDKGLIWGSSSGLGTAAAQTRQSGRAAADVAALRAMPGVPGVVMTNALPLTHRAWRPGVNRWPG